MTSPFGEIDLICNTRSGNGKVGRTLPEVESELARRGLAYRVHRTEYPGHATELARAALADGRTFLVAVGGDGTVHEVVNGMLENDAAVNPEAVLGIVAAGTGCDFIKTFGIPSTPAGGVALLEGPNYFPIDIGKVTYEENGTTLTRYFPNIAEVGLGAEVVARALRLPAWLGPTIYLAAFWLALRKHRIAHVKVDLVDRTYEGPMNNLIVANGQFFGGGMKIAPKAAPTDGLLDILIEHARKRESIALMQKIYKGAHLPHPDIVEAKRVKASIDCERPLRIEADGELLGYTPATFEVLRDALHLKV